MNEDSIVRELSERVVCKVRNHSLARGWVCKANSKATNNAALGKSHVSTEVISYKCMNYTR